MIPRRLEKKITETLKSTSSVALMGPRQVGKTTLAFHISKNFPSVYLDLENPRDLQKVSDIEAFHTGNRNKLIILDEVQRLPGVFAPIRGIIDARRREGDDTGLFLFLGSASIELLQQSSETLAGRISYIELYPVDALEYLEGEENNQKLNTLWVRGGFPDSLLAENDNQSLDWRYDFIKTYLERDIPQLGPRVPATTLERFWAMLAHSQGNTVNASKLAANIDVSSVTVGRYIDLLVDLLLIRKLQPWTFNMKKRLVKSPRIYVRDSGIVHALLNIPAYNDLLGHPVVGKSWEGFVIENIMAVLPRRVRPYYYRTAGGAEIDLILEFGTQERWAIEIKRSTSPSLSKGFFEACDDITASRKYVIYAGNDEFPMENEVTAISLMGFMEILQALKA